MNKDLFSLSFDADKQLIHVSGELSFATVNKVLVKTKEVFSPATDLNIEIINEEEFLNRIRK